jgi:hypothetical protein
MRWSTLISIILFSCNKEKHTEQGPCHDAGQSILISDAGLQQAKYKTGTYWVFYDSLSLSIDSNIITSQSSGTITAYCGVAEVHTFSLTKFGTSVGNLENYRVDQFGITQNPTENLIIPKIYFPSYSADNSAAAHTSMDSIFIYNQYYKNVMTTSFTNDPIEPGYKAIYYFNTDFGFLRKDLFNSANQLIKKRQLIRVKIIR